MNEIIEMEPELLPLQELANISPVVTFTVDLQKNDITPEYIAKAKNAIASINTNLNTDEDFVVAKKNSEACKTAEIHLSNLLTKIINGNEDISKINGDIQGIIADLSWTRLTINKKVKDRNVTLKNEITDAGKKELSRVISLTTMRGIFNPDMKSIDDCIFSMRSYDKMREKVAANVIYQVYNLAWSEVAYHKNNALIDSSLAKYPGIHADRKVIVLEPTDKLELMIAQRESSQELLLKKQEEDRIAKAKAEEIRIAAEKKGS